MAYWNEDLGYQFNAWKAKLCLYSLTKFLEPLFDFLKIYLLFLFFGSYHHPFDAKTPHRPYGDQVQQNVK